MAPRQPSSTLSDHDLLIRIDQKVESLQAAMRHVQDALDVLQKAIESQQALSAQYGNVRWPWRM